MTPTTRPRTGIDAQLDRHEQRRHAGVPTVSALAGRPAALARELRSWTDRQRRPLVILDPGPPATEPLSVAWVGCVASACDLREAAAAWLARRLPAARPAPAHALLTKTPAELELFLEGVLPGDSPSAAQALCRGILMGAGAASGEGDRDAHLAERLDAMVAAFSPPETRLLAALGELVPVPIQPVLALIVKDVAEGTGQEHPCSLPARLLAELAIAQPRLSLALIAEAEAIEDYLGSAPDSRAKALLRESVVVRHDDPAECVVHPLEAAAASCEPSRGSMSEDQARSAEERYLFECLQSMPETAGLFRLNAAIAVPRGTNRAIEVDLLAESLRLAVEIDGYRHFQDAECYRRDRRKDLELQKHGYLVVRVLAEDVVRGLEQVLETIRDAVAHRRGQLEDLKGGCHE